MTDSQISQRRRWLAAAAGLVIASGLASRSAAPALPEFVANYAGDTLWASLVFLILAMAMPKLRAPALAATACAIAFSVELLQLYQAPWLNAIRDTLPGRLVLGQGFLFSDLLCYTIGIALTAIIFQVATGHHLRDVATIAAGAITTIVIVAVAASNFGAGPRLFGFIDHVPGRDKTAHFLLMGALSFSTVLAFAPRLKTSLGRASCRLILGLCGIITLEEVSQHFIAARSFSIADLLASLTGAGIFGWLAHLVASANAIRPTRHRGDQ